jgi:hypothetical protein
MEGERATLGVGSAESAGPNVVGNPGRRNGWVSGGVSGKELEPRHYARRSLQARHLSPIPRAGLKGVLRLRFDSPAACINRLEDRVEYSEGPAQGAICNLHIKAWALAWLQQRGTSGQLGRVLIGRIRAYSFEFYVDLMNTGSLLAFPEAQGTCPVRSYSTRSRPRKNCGQLSHT